MASKYGRVEIFEVGPRDGLQNQAKFIATPDKLTFIEQLAKSGLKNIEVSSFASPKWVPQFQDATEIHASLPQSREVHHWSLIPNLKGLENAQKNQVNCISVICTASEQFAQKNTNCNATESFRRCQEIIQQALASKIRIRAYISCVFGCPYEGKVAFQDSITLLEKLLDLGCEQVSLGDTIGVANPDAVRRFFKLCRSSRSNRIAGHFHNTYGMALANVMAALDSGVRVFDSSCAGIGGCPYAKGASGNLASEDLCFMLQQMGYQVDVDLDKLLHAGRFIRQQLGATPNSKLLQIPPESRWR